MRKKLGTILLAISISTLLSSCLVDKRKAVEKISRTTDTLRIYQDGNYIDYNVTAIINTDTSTTTQYGTLRIKWENTAPFQDPFDNTIPVVPPVLKETTTLTYDGNTTGDPDAIVIRYISQVNTDPADPSQGSMTLYAIDDQLGAHYWPYAPASLGNPSSPVFTPVIFDSPMGFGPTPNSPQAFSVMECSSNLCNNEIYKYNNSFNIVGDSREIDTELGIFSNPFEVSLLGDTQPQNEPAVSFVGDILDICGDSTESIGHHGSMFVMPQIGVIQMTNTCTNNTTGDSVNYVIAIRETSFQF